MRWSTTSEGLCAGDNIRHAIWQSRVLGDPVLEAPMRCGVCGFRGTPHRVEGFNADHLPSPLRPDERGEARATAQSNDQVRAGGVRQLQEHIEESRWWSGTIGVVPICKPRTHVAGAVRIQYGIIRFRTHVDFLQGYSHRTPGMSRCRKRERGTSGRWRQSAPYPCSVRFGRDVGLLSQPHGSDACLECDQAPTAEAPRLA